MWGLFVAALCVATLPAAATDRVALLIGNRSYDLKSLVLRNPANDVVSLTGPLRRLGFEVEIVTDADRPTMESAVARFAKRSTGAEIALFFYAGHAVQLASTNYLLGTSLPAIRQDLAVDHALNANMIRNAFRSAKPNLGVVILDACRDNPFSQKHDAVDAIAKPGLARQQGVGEVQGKAGFLFAYATDPGNVAFDGEGDNSFFTGALLKHLETPGLEIRLMFGRVRQEVVTETRGIQVPWLEEAVIGTHYLRSAPAPAPAADAQFAGEVAFWDQAHRNGDIDLMQDYLKRYPKGLFSSLAPLAIERLRRNAPASTAPPDIQQLSFADKKRASEALTVLGFFDGREQNIPNRSLEHAAKDYLRIFKRERFNVDMLVIDAGRDALLLGATLGREIATDLARLRGINRAVDEVALPTLQVLERKLADRANAQEILAKPRAEVASMQKTRERFLARLDQSRGLYENLLQRSRSLELSTAIDERSLASGGVMRTDLFAKLKPYAEKFRRHVQQQVAPATRGTYRWLADFSL